MTDQLVAAACAGENGTGRPCTIHLVRHGRTVMNVEVRFRGRLDVPLDSTGRREALEAARNLVGTGLDSVYTSPLARAREVAIAIAAASGLSQIHDAQGLVNLDYGAWEGLTKEECALRDPDLFRLYADDPERASCPGGESLASAADRMVDELLAIGRRHPGQSVAAVTHGAMVRLAVLRVAGPSSSDWQFKLPTGSATVFQVEDGCVRLISAPARVLPDPRKAAAHSFEAAEYAV
ncbi:MAG: histidine phosphatase family protein [Mycobacteriaceae bacterium]